MRGIVLLAFVIGMASIAPAESGVSSILTVPAGQCVWRAGDDGLVTCLALRIEQDGTVAMVNAGHLPPYLNGVELAVEGALPLGAVPGLSFLASRFKLSEGDSLILMTDGVVEAQDGGGHLFGFERVGDLLSKGTTGDMLATIAQDFGQQDDITVLTLSFAPVGVAHA
jgi:serine phosphatase RsbU (regulator of sigma subunit)